MGGGKGTMDVGGDKGVCHCFLSVFLFAPHKDTMGAP